MSSGFVSGGTNEAPIERDDEWLQAQQAIDAARREKIERGKQAEGKSLYEVLQQNKAAKQEAFEESIKLRHQFQALDEDDAEYLDSVRDSERAKEDAVRKETREQLEAFRKQREAADSGTIAAENLETGVGNTSPTTAQDHQHQQWLVSGKKRRRGQEKELLKGVKLRKASSSEQAPPSKLVSDSKDIAESPVDDGDKTIQTSTNHAKPIPTNASEKSPTLPKATQAAIPSKPVPGLGLGAYGSDSD